ncbi:uroporphyrin-3 C-methyltransferase [Thiohalospira halophila DSM 15071]|uniref:Uroporphyrin-3 C-methyltransferase n=1 Tax=Thiohalospira halophila DSM 15071 TaxID=1123397 RepID=A0A1I1VDX4_9GAMM|nr:uroporphyrinogen-III C-methyltransferase [Thiohalospira halophila]SFD81136.1 uroporphyrin-3 C-methyltransferase [Thiohalospira halophila DSM 15071]
MSEEDTQGRGAEAGDTGGKPTAERTPEAPSTPAREDAESSGSEATSEQAAPKGQEKKSSGNRKRGAGGSGAAGKGSAGNGAAAGDKSGGGSTSSTKGGRGAKSTGRKAGNRGGSTTKATGRSGGGATTSAEGESAGPASGRGLTAALVVLLVLVAGAAGAGGWFGWQLWQQQAELEQTLADRETAIRRLQGRLEEVGDTARSAREAAAGSAARAEDVSEGLEATNTELERLAEQVGRGSEEWQLAAVRHLLTLADQRAALAADWPAVDAALAAADERLADLGGARYQPLREAIATVRQEVAAVEPPDVPGLAARLTGVSAAVDDLPLRRPGGAPRPEANGPTEPVSGWRGAVAAVGDALSELVVVRRHDEDVRPLVAPEQEENLRLNLQLQLESARVALLRGETGTWRDTLEQARMWVERYFDTSAAATEAALASLEELAGAELEYERPDPGRALEVLDGIQGGDAP